MSHSMAVGLSVCAALACLSACGEGNPSAYPVPASPPANLPATPRPTPQTAATPVPATTPAAAAAPSTGAPAPSQAPSGGGAHQDLLALAGKSGCLACHSIEKKIVGPAWKNVAAKYRGQPGAESKLVQKVKNGGAGVWGSTPMPPNSQVSEADIKKLVDAILKLK